MEKERSGDGELRPDPEDYADIRCFCFHDVDLVPEAEDIKETSRRLDKISEYILGKMRGTDIKCLWDTANMFSKPRFMNGAGSTNSADVFCFAAAQVKKALDITVKLGGRGCVFWGGREGYETLLNTDVKLEQENIAIVSIGNHNFKGFRRSPW